MMKKVLPVFMIIVASLVLAASAHAWVQAGACRFHVFPPTRNAHGQYYGRAQLDNCSEPAFGTRRLWMKLCLQGYGNRRWYNITCWLRGPWRASVVCTWGAGCPWFPISTSAFYFHSWMRSEGWATVDYRWGHMIGNQMHVG